ncbi:MAG: hypothetical protein PHN82_05660 [bacterium]|nr:hypothetical protein [bacterium]
MRFPDLARIDILISMGYPAAERGGERRRKAPGEIRRCHTERPT